MSELNSPKRLRNVAADVEYSQTQLRELIDQVQRETPIFEYSKRARSGADPDVKLLFREPPSDLVFGVSEQEWGSIASAAGLDEDEEAAVRLWHDRRGTDLLAMEAVYNRNELSDDESYLVIRLPRQEYWSWTVSELGLWFEDLANNGMTPAEMLDYWAIEELGYSPSEWANSRNVSPEAVRKNVRQARQKWL